jgi:integrase
MRSSGNRWNRSRGRFAELSPICESTSSGRTFGGRSHAENPRELGRALSADEQHRLLTACKKVRSRSLYSAVLLSLHTGLRNAERRLLRWRKIDFLEK